MLFYKQSPFSSLLPNNLVWTFFDALSERDLQAIHDILMKKKIINGSMVCPGCNHVFSIKNGIPNMLLNENEV